MYEYNSLTRAPPPPTLPNGTARALATPRLTWARKTKPFTLSTRSALPGPIGSVRPETPASLAPGTHRPRPTPGNAQCAPPSGLHGGPHVVTAALDQRPAPATPGDLWVRLHPNSASLGSTQTRISSLTGPLPHPLQHAPGAHPFSRTLPEDVGSRSTRATSKNPTKQQGKKGLPGRRPGALRRARDAIILEELRREPGGQRALPYGERIPDATIPRRTKPRVSVGGAVATSAGANQRAEWRPGADWRGMGRGPGWGRWGLSRFGPQAAPASKELLVGSRACFSGMLD